MARQKVKHDPAKPEAYQLLHDGVIALAEIEANGIRIDTQYLKRARCAMQQKAKEKAKKLKQTDFFRRWKRRFGDKTKLGSGQQLSRILFDEMGFENPSEEGKYKYDESTLEKIDHPFVKQWMSLEKMKGVDAKFLSGIEKETVDGFLHPFFDLHTARTYRSSSSSPNFQNFPKRNKNMERLVRRCVIPRKGNVLIEVDYGALEVRISACYNRDPLLIDYIKDPAKDMHRDMAMEIFKCSAEEVSKDSRYCAKNQFVFPQFYGSYWLECAKNLWESMERMNLKVNGTSMREWMSGKGIDRLGHFERHIRDLENWFWQDRFSVYAQWKLDWFKQYVKEGGYYTLTGFRIDGVYGRNDVINYPIQGTAFHCLLWSLIQVVKSIRRNKMQAKVVGQIHDSIIFDCPVNEIQDILNMTKRIMTEDIIKHWEWIIVPLIIEAEISEESWYQKEEWTEQDGEWKAAA